MMPRGKYNRRNINRGPYRKYHEEDRKKIIKAYEDGRNWRNIAQIIGINERTANEWIRKSTMGETTKKKGGALHCKKRPDILQALIRTIENDATVTLSALSQKVQHEFGIRVCKSTVKNWLDGQLLSVKKLRPHPVTMNSMENKNLRSNYVEQVFQDRSQGRTIIWLDETNFNLFCKRTEGRSRIGTRANVIQPSCRGSNLHCIAAMTSTRMLRFTIKRGSYNAELCKTWIRELIDSCANEGISRPTIVLDNAPAHARVESVIEEGDDVKILRLAPYSFLLNPIELYWSSFKAEVKRKLQEIMSELMSYQRQGQGPSIAEYRMQKMECIALDASSHFTAQQLSGYTNHVERYYASVLRCDNLVEIP